MFITACLLFTENIKHLLLLYCAYTVCGCGHVEGCFYVSVWRFFLLAYVCGERVFKKKQPNCVGHKAVICWVMIDGSRFFDVWLVSLQVSQWNDCMVWIFCVISCLCVLTLGKSPDNKTPPSLFHPQCQPNADKKNAFFRRHTHRHIKWSWIYSWVCNDFVNCLPLIKG